MNISRLQKIFQRNLIKNMNTALDTNIIITINYFTSMALFEGTYINCYTTIAFKICPQFLSIVVTTNIPYGDQTIDRSFAMQYEHTKI